MLTIASLGPERSEMRKLEHARQTERQAGRVLPVKLR